jgi:hypothetical protein
MFSGIRPKAVLWGIVTDLGVTFLAIMVLTALLGVGAGRENLSEEEARQLLESTFQQPGYMLLGSALGLLATTLGGYVAAKLAGVAPLLNAACVGLFGVILGLLSIGHSPLWFALLSIVLTPPAAIAGGVLWRRSSAGGRAR